MRPRRATSPQRTPRQLCLVCAIVEDLVTIALSDWREGRFDDVGEALAQMRVQITGDASGYEIQGVRQGT